MKALLASLALAVLGMSSPASARIWPDGQLDDLENAAEAAPVEGMPVPAEFVARLDLARHLYDLGVGPADAVDNAADALFQRLINAYARGWVDPATVDPDWHMDRPAPPNTSDLDRSLDAGVSPSWLLAGLLPDAEDYRVLRAELTRLSALPVADPERAHIPQLRANLERWRWLPRFLPLRRVEVRLAQFELYVHQDDTPPVRHAVIIGARRTPTPVFAAQIESITLNPYWEPPSSIASGELLPRFRRSPGSAASEGFEAIDSAGRVVTDVNWAARPFPYRIRQRPGANNALGQIRLDLPNPYAVYLHDTPTRRLFARDERAFSHGCIRVENPVALAATLMASPDWTEAALQAAIDTGENQSIDLATPVPIYILYLTAVAQADGAVLYSHDIYHRDDALIAALNRADASVVALAADASQSCPAPSN